MSLRLTVRMAKKTFMSKDWLGHVIPLEHALKAMDQSDHVTKLHITRSCKINFQIHKTSS